MFTSFYNLWFMGTMYGYDAFFYGCYILLLPGLPPSWAQYSSKSLIGKDLHHF